MSTYRLSNVLAPRSVALVGNTFPIWSDRVPMRGVETVAEVERVHALLQLIHTAFQRHQPKGLVLLGRGAGGSGFDGGGTAYRGAVSCIAGARTV